MKGVALFNYQSQLRLAQRSTTEQAELQAEQQEQEENWESSDDSLMSTTSITPKTGNAVTTMSTSNSTSTSTNSPSKKISNQLFLSSTNTAAPLPKNTACLTACILSAYDLPSRSPPSYVSITVGDKTLITGPPAQRHKDRNSFKFAGAKNAAGLPSNQVLLDAPRLAHLYQQTVTVQLVYEHAPTRTLTAEYQLQKLKIHETTWLILNLEPRSTGTGTASSVNTTTEDSHDEEVPPTLRLQMTLDGPYRTEIAALMQLGQVWFGFVDAAERNIKQVTTKIPASPVAVNPKLLLLPAVPVVACVVVTAPLVIGVLLLGLPVFLPLAVALGTALLCLGLAIVVVYSSTVQGRAQVGGMLAPLVHTVLSTPSGQSAVYQTGSRPTPVNVARAILPAGMWQRLAASLLIDLIGSSSYLLPFVGEGADIAWAPVQTILIMAMYDRTSPNLKYVSFVEEILPFTDIVPSATIGWLAQFGLPMVLSKAEENNIHIDMKSVASRLKQK
jgi:hypothetical protein